MGEVTKITRYRCTDGEEYDNEDSANEHEQLIERVDEANKKYSDGCSLYEAFEIAELPYLKNIPESFKDVTHETKLVIEYWQCCDKPGYSPLRITYNGMVFVHGDVGAWAGPYGRPMRIDDLQRYVEGPKDEDD